MLVHNVRSELFMLKDTFRPLVVHVLNLFGVLPRGAASRMGRDGFPKCPCGAHARARSPELCVKWRHWGGDEWRYVLRLC